MRWLERQRCFLDFTLSSLWRQKGKNLSLLAVYTLVIFLLGSVIFFTDAMRKQAEAILADAPEMIVQRMMAGRQELVPLSYMEKIKKIRGVRSVEPRLWGYYFHPASRTNYTLMVSNDFPYGNDAVEVGQGVLRTWQPDPEGKLYFKAYSGEAIGLKVASTFDAVTDLVSADLIITSETTFRKLTGFPPGFATDLSVRIANEKECPTIAQKISSNLPGTRAILREEILRTYKSLFGWRSGYILVLLSGAILAFLIFAWDKATGLSAEEKTEIGILKGVGWDSADILAMKFWEGIAISLTALLLGTTIAYIHVFLASASLFEHALKGWAILYPTFRLQPDVSLYQLAVLGFLAVVPYTFITLLPIWKISVTDPDLVMRQ